MLVESVAVSLKESPRSCSRFTLYRNASFVDRGPNLGRVPGRPARPEAESLAGSPYKSTGPPCETYGPGRRATSRPFQQDRTIYPGGLRTFGSDVRSRRFDARRPTSTPTTVGGQRPGLHLRSAFGRCGASAKITSDHRQPAFTVFDPGSTPCLPSPHRHNITGADGQSRQTQCLTQR
jgi:hypothetical protein